MGKVRSKYRDEVEEMACKDFGNIRYIDMQAKKGPTWLEDGRIWLAWE
jgi:hypothetical protein